MYIGVKINEVVYSTSTTINNFAYSKNNGNIELGSGNKNIGIGFPPEISIGNALQIIINENAGAGLYWYYDEGNSIIWLSSSKDSLVRASFSGSVNFNLSGCLSVASTGISTSCTISYTIKWASNYNDISFS